MDKTAIDSLKLKVLNLKINNIIFEHDNFANLSKIVNKNFEKDYKFDGIVFDLGLSNIQLKDSSRGFSFKTDSPLNMSFDGDNNNERSTEILVNKSNEYELERILREYGEEKFAKRIAGEIVSSRRYKKIKTVKELVEIIKKAVPINYQHQKIHFATRTFQALRIATNNELMNLRLALPQAVELLNKGGKIAVVSYHSLEDRIVKNYFRLESKDCICPPNYLNCQCSHKATLKILTKKIIIPSDKELIKNPSSRSAKLRVAEKI
jgi:16S rRNA (cytosine1402-N4)-methyltransferase